MKIALAHCFYRTSAPSGEDSVYRREKSMLEHHGHEVVALEKFNDDIQDHNLKSKLSVAKNAIWSRPALDETKAFLAHHKPDIIHFHNTFPQMSQSVYLAAKALDIPVIQTLHNYRFICSSGLLMRDNQPCELCIRDTGGIVISPSLQHKCYRDSLVATLPLALNIKLNNARNIYNKQVDQFIALTNFAKSKLVQSGIKSELISVKPNFIEDKHVHKNEALRQTTYQTTKDSQDTALFIGRLSKEKGIEVLIDALAKHPTFKVTIIGDGELRQELERKCASLNLNVSFLGQLPNDQVLKELSSASYVIIPSLCYEGFPAVIAESFAYSKPVIASNLGSLAEIVEHNHNGLLFEPGNHEDLASKILSLHGNTQKLESLSQNARNDFDSYYSESANITMLEKIYRQAITKSRSKIDALEIEAF